MDMVYPVDRWTECEGFDIGLVSAAPLSIELDSGWIVIILWILRDLQRQRLSVVPLSTLSGSRLSGRTPALA
jgi:hypothetical protein